jgi:hypothetical protein
LSAVRRTALDSALPDDRIVVDPRIELGDKQTS